MPQNTTVYAVQIKAFLCPSDIRDRVLPDQAPCNYAACSGNGLPGGFGLPASYGTPNGIYYFNSATTIAGITDGTSNTAMLGERCYKLGNLFMGAGTVFGCSPLAAGYSSRTRVINNALGIPYWGMNQTVTSWQHQNRSFSSVHPGGAQFALCDGSVRFISETIDFRGNSIGGMTSANQGVDSTFERLLSRNDGQVVGDF